MSPELHLTIEIGKTYQQAASLTSHASMLDHDRAAQIKLQTAAGRVLSTARELVRLADAGSSWVAVDRNAHLGLVEFTRSHAKDVVAGVRAHVA